MKFNIHIAFIVGVIISYPINIQIFSFLRATDILIISMFMRRLYVNKFWLPFDMWIKVLSLIMIASTINGILFVGVTGIDRMPFIYKLILPFLVYDLINESFSKLTLVQLAKVKVFFIRFTIMFSFWPFVYFTLHYTNAFDLNTD